MAKLADGKVEEVNPREEICMPSDRGGDLIISKFMDHYTGQNAQAYLGRRDDEGNLVEGQWGMLTDEQKREWVRVPGDNGWDALFKGTGDRGKDILTSLQIKHDVNTINHGEPDRPVQLFDQPEDPGKTFVLNPDGKSYKIMDSDEAMNIYSKWLHEKEKRKFMADMKELAEQGWPEAKIGKITPQESVLAFMQGKTPGQLRREDQAFKTELRQKQRKLHELYKQEDEKKAIASNSQSEKKDTDPNNVE